jgi:hypothetical protein
MALATADIATTDFRTSSSRSRAERVGDGVIAGYIQSLARGTRRPYNPARGPERADHAGVAELVDAPVLGAGGLTLMGVRVPPPAFRLKRARRNRSGLLLGAEPAC